MKNNQMTFALVGLLFLSTLLTFVSLLWYNRSLRSLADIQPKMLQAREGVPVLVRMMLTDAVEYGKKNPAIEPMLKKYIAPANAPAPAK